MRRLICSTVTPALDVWNGFGSRDLLQVYRSRPPMWSSNPRGWIAQPSDRADLTALAELRGYVVVLEEAEVIR